MISKEAIKRGYNRGNYVVGAHTPPPYSLNRRQAARPSRPACSAPGHGVAAAGRCAAGGGRRGAGAAGRRHRVDARLVGRVDGRRDGGRPATPHAVVVRVSTVEQVQAVMRIAHAATIPVTASAGRSNVTGAALPVRGGIVLDVCGLNRLIGVDTESQIVDVEAGMFGDVFEETLQREHGLTMGHWPSSFGISTVGGWIACRGAGQLSTRYGKIEDMVFGMDVVLADGSLVTLGGHSRAAVGPDLQQLFIGSEGTLGIIVRARLKLHRLPDYGRAIAYGFDTFAAGLDACREILQRGANPARCGSTTNWKAACSSACPIRTCC